MRCRLVIFMITLVVGCAGRGPYRTGPASVETIVADTPLCPERSEPARHTARVAYVEIDEQGYFQDRGQVDRALAVVREGDKPKYVVVFVHGWFHNAGLEDENVRRFKCALANLQNIDGNTGEDVVGVYVGWRGASWTLPMLRYLTFWDRKNTSDEIGRGSLVEFLTRLERAAKPDPASVNKLMVVGHSFGASVVFNAIGQILMERFVIDAEKLAAERGAVGGRRMPARAAQQADHPQSKPGLISGYGDLVVLVNPALEATRIMPFFASLNDYTSRDVNLFFDGQPPRLVILSSEDDNATRRAFPAARVFSTLPEAYQDHPVRTPYGRQMHFRERYLDWQTMGNAESLQTHAGLTRTASSPWDGKCPPADPEWLRASIDARRAQQRREGQPATGAGWSYTFPGTGIRLTHHGITTPSNPLWIQAVDRDLIRSHSAIANPILICYFDGLLGDPKRVNPQAEMFQQQRAPR
jgi:pimeloyl-ACP methyl ester carboxylesterase